MTTEKTEEKQADTPELGPFGPPANKFVFQWLSLPDDNHDAGNHTEVARVGGIERGGCLVRTETRLIGESEGESDSCAIAICFVPGVALGDFGIELADRCRLCRCGSSDWADYAVDGAPTGKRYCSNCHLAEPG